jgi:hypothetical protein
MDYYKKGRDARMLLEAKERAAVTSKGMRESLYSHIKVSVRTVDIIIFIVSLLLIASIVIGITQG